jgi:GNAT superfamily N-acetyltransferase
MNVEIIDTNADNILSYGVCGYKDIKKAGYPEKLKWLKERYAEGLKIKTLYSEQDGTQGMIEYIPGEKCWRPVEATGYMFIHCIFAGFKSVYKRKGYGTLLLNECITEAKKKNYYGVAVVTRQGPFMAGRELFVKNGFEVVEKVAPDFELLSIKFSRHATVPKFKENWKERLARYPRGLTIVRADQCPYTVKNVKDICDLAEKTFVLKPAIIHLKNCVEAQDSPCPFGTFGIIFNGKVIAYHPISGTRFANIMKKELGK